MAKTLKHPQLFLLVWLVAVQLQVVYNLEEDDQKSREKSASDFHTQESREEMASDFLTQESTEKSASDFLTLFVKVESTMTSLKQNLDEIKQSVAEKLERCKNYNVSALFLSFREELNALLDKFHLEVTNNGEPIVDPTDKPTKEPTILRHCADVYDHQSQITGVYTIQPSGSEPFQVYCDMTTDGGGWTVFQKRGDFPGIPEDNFYRGWQEYTDGFGDLKTEFWTGLTRISLMTKPENGYQELRVDLTDLDGSKAYAKYQNFFIEDEEQKFRLRLQNYSGDAGDSMGPYNMDVFSTFDRDNDGWSSGSCAEDRSGAWWYYGCTYANLNGLNLKSKKTAKDNGIYWYHWKGDYYSLSQTEMKFRPMNWAPKNN